MIFPYNESFTGSGVPSNWVLSGAAKLDTGWLRLVPAEQNKSGTALLNLPFPSSDGISVQFDFAASGAKDINKIGDGISFFLIDGEYDTKPGGHGGALGYSYYHKGTGGQEPGVTHGYIGIGIDQWGNFSNPDEVAEGGRVGRTPNQVVLRGSGNEYVGYRYLTGKSLPSELTGQEATRGRPARILLSVIDRKVTVAVLRNGNWNRLIEDYDLSGATGQAALPKTLKLGFSGSTGDATNNYEIRNLEVTLPADFPLEITGPQSATTGSVITYTITVENKGPNPVPDATITATLPAEVSSPSFEEITLSGGASKTASGTFNGHEFTQPLNLPVGGKAVVPLKCTIGTGTKGTITCEAKVSSSTCANTATRQSDRVSTVVSEPKVAAVSLTMSGPQIADSDKPITYIMTVKNDGPSDVTNASITGTYSAEFTAPVFAPGGATAGDGKFSYPLNLPKNSEATITLTGTPKSNFTGSITVTSEIQTPGTTNTSSQTNGRVTTKIQLPKIDIRLKEPPKGSEQSWPEEYKGYIWTYDFQLQANKNRILQWQLSFDGLPTGSKFNPAYTHEWYTVVDDGAVTGRILIQSTGTGHSIEPNTPLVLQQRFVISGAAGVM